jgi:hypothetical protein
MELHLCTSFDENPCVICGKPTSSYIEYREGSVRIQVYLCVSHPGSGHHPHFLKPTIDLCFRSIREMLQGRDMFLNLKQAKRDAEDRVFKLEQLLKEHGIDTREGR